MLGEVDGTESKAVFSKTHDVPSGGEKRSCSFG
jgi:hypothetical protein